jgi:hypothetical protein
MFDVRSLVFDVKVANAVPAKKRPLPGEAEFVCFFLAFFPGISQALTGRRALHTVNMLVTQHSLIARLRNGGSDSDWENFAALYKRPILAFAASRSLNEFDCCDVFQEFLIRMYRFTRTLPANSRGRIMLAPTRIPC